jgi:hypothetical protein
MVVGKTGFGRVSDDTFVASGGAKTVGAEGV